MELYHSKNIMKIKMPKAWLLLWEQYNSIEKKLNWKKGQIIDLQASVSTRTNDAVMTNDNDMTNNGRSMRIFNGTLMKKKNEDKFSSASQTMRTIDDHTKVKHTCVWRVYLKKMQQGLVQRLPKQSSSQSHVDIWYHST